MNALDKFGGATRYDPDRHRLIEPNDFVKYLRGEFRCDSLDVVYDAQGGKVDRAAGARHGCWMVVEWLDGRRGRMKELIILGDRPVGTREHVLRLVAMDKASDKFRRSVARNRKVLQGYHQGLARQDEADSADVSDAEAEIWRRPGLRGTKAFAVPA